MNVPEGEVTVTAMTGVHGVTFSRAKVYIHKGAVTEAFLSPMPSSALQ